MELDGPGLTNFFADPAEAAQRISARFGVDAKLRKLTIYGKFVIFEVLDEDKNMNVARYTLGRIGLSPPDPVLLLESDEVELEKHLFPLAQVSFDKLPSLIAEAKRELDFEGAEVGHITIDDGHPFRKGLGFSIYISSDRHSGHVSFHNDGKLYRVYK